MRCAAVTGTKGDMAVVLPPIAWRAQKKNYGTESAL